MLTIFFFFLFFILHLTLSDQWYSKSQCTQKEFANHMDINCNSNEFILIGWSHYGTKKNFDNLNSSIKCEPSENDCIMDYTHKIAELCNGVSKCEVILTQQFIHKCSDEATYLFISYQCIQNSTIIDVCSKRSITSSNGLNLISPMFPNEYPNNINCTCSIESKKKSIVIIDVENLSFNLQDNDKLLSFSGAIPFGASLLTSKNELNLRFQTDETLSQSGFWIRLYGYQQCHPDEFPLGSKCLKIFSEKQKWKLAKDKCLSMNSNLIHLHDIIQEKKLAYFFFTHNEQSTSFWISNEKEKYDGYNSWWPWRSSTILGKCVLRTQDGWIKRPCNEEYGFICERDINRQSIPLTIRCGNIQSTTISSTKITPIIITQRTSIEQLSSTINPKFHKKKLNTINSNILAMVLGGVAIIILSLNMLICYTCKKRTENQSPSKTQNDSNTSLTHEELQHSLIQDLYHEKTNTISSISTSSSTSKHSQSKSNDTTTISSNLFQLSPPSTNPLSTELCFQNPHSIDYHIYETIPSENLTYTLCTTHSAFKPVIQSNTHTIRPYYPRTNILYHHPDSSKLPTIVMPICCHHYSTGTLRQHVLPTQIYTRSESIV